jgi:hypothetical protein
MAKFASLAAVAVCLLAVLAAPATGAGSHSHPSWLALPSFFLLCIPQQGVYINIAFQLI